LGVWWPSVVPPPYAPKSLQPVSSVISITMLGRLVAAEAGGEEAIAARAVTATATVTAVLRPILAYSDGVKDLRLSMTRTSKILRNKTRQTFRLSAFTIKQCRRACGEKAMQSFWLGEEIRSAGF
jgi:hypothetical protein